MDFFASMRPGATKGKDACRIDAAEQLPAAHDGVPAAAALKATEARKAVADAESVQVASSGCGSPDWSKAGDSTARPWACSQSYLCGLICHLDLPST